MLDIALWPHTGAAEAEAFFPCQMAATKTGLNGCTSFGSTGISNLTVSYRFKLNWFGFGFFFFA